MCSTGRTSIPGFFTMTPDSSTNCRSTDLRSGMPRGLLKSKILEAATRPQGVTSRGQFPAGFPGMKPEDLDIKDSVIFVKKDPSIRKTIAELVGPAGGEGPLCTHAGNGEGRAAEQFYRTSFCPRLAGAAGRLCKPAPPAMPAGAFHGSRSRHRNRRGRGDQGCERK